MAKLKIGDINLFQVSKKDDNGYVLSHEEGNVMMRYYDAVEQYEVGDHIEAFLYIDHSKGLAATTKTPYIDQYHADFVKVVEKKPGLGVFVDIGLKKDMLVSKDDLPHIKKQWPEIGDTLFCYLKTARKQMVARPVSRFRILDYLKPKTVLEVGDTIKTYVFRHADEGYVLFSEEGHEIFVYYKHTRKEYRFGEAVEVTITVVRDDKHYNGTLIGQKEDMMEDDAKRIYDYLQENRMMPLTDKSDPAEIFELFHMSKAAFKRALGQLYKAGKIELGKDKTEIKA